MHTPDEYDLALLRLLQQNNQLTTEDLSKKVNLSQSAVHRRLAKLRREKLIEADVSIISPKVAGIGITCVVGVELCDGTSKSIENFKKAMARCGEVSQCYYVTGSYDFILVVNTRDMGHFEVFQRKNLLDNSSLKRFYTHVVMDKVKVEYGVRI